MRPGVEQLVQCPSSVAASGCVEGQPHLVSWARVRGGGVEQRRRGGGDWDRASVVEVAPDLMQKPTGGGLAP
ncbi:MAG TPA: hypothetical protein VGD71_44910 [Kribbella sp.]